MKNKTAMNLEDIFELDRYRAMEIEEFVQRQLLIVELGGSIALKAHQAILDFCESKNEVAYAFMFVGGFVSDIMKDFDA